MYMIIWIFIPLDVLALAWIKKKLSRIFLRQFNAWNLCKIAQCQKNEEFKLSYKIFSRNWNLKINSQIVILA